MKTLRFFLFLLDAVGELMFLIGKGLVWLILRLLFGGLIGAAYLLLCNIIFSLLNI